MRPVALLIAALLLCAPRAVAAEEKVGMLIYNRVTWCTPSYAVETHYVANPWGRTFHWQSYRYFLGAKAIEVTGKIDAGFQLYLNGNFIDMIQRDIYAEPTGPNDVGGRVTFATPWVVGPTDVIVIYPGCVSWGSGSLRPGQAQPAAEHVAIGVEGYLE